MFVWTLTSSWCSNNNNIIIIIITTKYAVLFQGMQVAHALEIDDVKQSKSALITIFRHNLPLRPLFMSTVILNEVKRDRSAV